MNRGFTQISNSAPGLVRFKNPSLQSREAIRYHHLAILIYPAQCHDPHEIPISARSMPKILSWWVPAHLDLAQFYRGKVTTGEPDLNNEDN